MAKTQRSAAPLIVAVLLLLLPVLYVGSYSALVVPLGIWNDSGDSWRHYRIEGNELQRFFYPIEQIDRKLRPVAWDEKARQQARIKAMLEGTSP